MSISVAVAGANDVAHDGGHARITPTPVGEDGAPRDVSGLLHGVAL